MSELVRIAAFMAPFCASFLITNYLATCIGSAWLPLLAWAAEPPSFTGGAYLGGFSFLVAWSVMSLPALLNGDHRRSKRQPWSTLVHESAFDAEAVGWATTVQLATWILWGATGI